MQLKVFSKFDCFLKLGFRKLEFQPKIKFLKLDLDLTWIKKKKRKKKVEFEFHLKKITELVFASFEFHRVYFFKSMELKFTKLEFHFFFFFFSFLKIHIKCIWETRFWVGTQVSKNNTTY